MIIDYKKEFRTDAKTDKDLWRAFTDERIMQGFAITLCTGVAPGGIAKALNNSDCYLGYWPMFYCEAMLMHNPGYSLDALMPEIARGVALCIEILARPKKHIPFVEAVIFWDHLICEKLVTHSSPEDFIDAILLENSVYGKFKHTQADIFSINHQSCVQRHKDALPILSQFLKKNTHIAEVVFGNLNREQLRSVAKLYPPEVWKPYCTSGKGNEFMLEHDLGL